jgi:hypothetical protein
MQGRFLRLLSPLRGEDSMGEMTKRKRLHPLNINILFLKCLYVFQP